MHQALSECEELGETFRKGGGQQMEIKDCRWIGS